MTDTATYGDPTDWDAIPAEFATALETELADRGWTVLHTDDDFLTIDAPGLDDDEEWCLIKPNFHCWWVWGVYERGHCPNPERLYVDPADPHAIAAAVDEILRPGANDDREPCGEGMCRCDHYGEQHGPCGCDCPRDEDGQLIND